MAEEEVQPTTYDWSAVYDAEGNIYYHNTVTDITTWDAPEQFNPPEEEPPEAEAAEAAAETTADNSKAWLKHETEDGEAYYHNTVTDETTWEIPEGFVEDDTGGDNDNNDNNNEGALPSSPVAAAGEDEEMSDAEPQSEEKKESLEDEEEAALPRSPIGGADDDEDDEPALPSSPIGGAGGFDDDNDDDDDDDNKNDSSGGEAGEWERLVDDETGQEYYYNETTNETTWEKPPGFKENGIKAESEDDAVVKAESMEEDGDAQDTEETGKGVWERLVDEESGQEYYHNEQTGETTWEKPPGFQENGAAKAETEEEDAVKVEPKEESKEPQGSGGSDWQKLTHDDGQEYYYNTKTEVTQWEKPDDFVEDAAATALSPRPDAAKAAVWHKFEDEEGRTYYANEATGATQWDPPEGFVDEDEKKDDDDDEFQGSPIADRSPSPMSVEEKEKEPEPEPEPEIDPAVKRVMDAEEALNKPDSVLEPGCTANVLEVVASQDGNPEKAIVALIDNFQGQTAICGTLAKWLADLRAASSNNSDVNEVVGTARHSVADGIRETAQNVVSQIAKERFSTTNADNILNLSKSEAAFLEDMIESNRWRSLLIDLSSTHKESALLMYCIRTISKRGYHRELVKRMNPSEYFSVFNAMLQSELTVVGKTAISASSDVDTSIGLEELVADLHRTCTATAFTYLYSIEVLRNLVAEAEEDSAATPGSRMRRAIRKWERLSEDLDTAMVDPATSASTAGSSTVFRKRRLDVALTISELHQRQRRRLKPTPDHEVGTAPNGNDQTKKLESGLEQFLRRFSVGTHVDDRVLDALLPTGLNRQAAADEVGNLLVTYPLSIRALLNNMFKTGSATRVGDSVRSKCSTLVALAVLASEKKARAEIGERAPADPDAPDEVALTSTVKRASELCEELATMASFVVTAGGKERGALASPGQQLCNLALKCATVAQGVLMWANEMTKSTEYPQSATYPTFSPSLLSLVRIAALRHPCTRKEASEIAFTFLRHNMSVEISYKKANEIKEQSLRLLLILVVYGEAPTILRRLTSLLQQGDVLKVDASLMRYFISGVIEVVRPPFSLPFVRLLGAVLKTPRCIEAVKSNYFGEANKKRLLSILADFKRSCNSNEGTATKDDVFLVNFLMKTYMV